MEDTEAAETETETETEGPVKDHYELRVDLDNATDRMMESSRLLIEAKVSQEKVEAKTRDQLLKAAGLTAAARVTYEEAIAAQVEAGNAWMKAYKIHIETRGY